jgi:hypothetical protein
MIKFSRAALGAALLAVAGIASAATTAAVTVSAHDNSLYGPTGGGAIAGLDGLDSGLSVDAGEFLTFSATGSWNNSDPDSSYTSGADGHDGFAGDAHPNFDYSQFGLNAAYGALVGKIGNGNYFLIGDSFTGNANATGELKLFYWDSDYANNTGSVNVQISAVPEPANIALMGLALGAFALSRRRKA